MLEALKPYGTNPAVSVEDGFSCGRLLFSVLPEDAFDHQPLERGPYKLVADVRLDNRSDLAAALGISSPKLRRLSDADVLFEALLRWGSDAAEKLIGEFAFALWNRNDQSLLLGRDLFGHRPLYFHEGSDFFAFATMPSGLHALPAIPREFDPESMAHELALLTFPGTRTHFRGIQRVPSGQVVRVTRGGVTSERYWQVPRSQSRPIKTADYEEGLRSVVDLAVKAQLRSTQDAVGSHLSGGLDSSVVTATAARQFDPGKIIAFTAAPREGFDGPVPPATIRDESHLAAQTARLYSNLEHVIVNKGDETLVDILDRQFAYMQQPTFGPCNSVWAREISRVAKARRLNVLLVGFTGNLTTSYAGREAWSALLTKGRLLKLLSIGARMKANGIAFRTLAAQLIGPILPRSLWTLACRLYGRPTDLSGYTAINPALRKAVEAKARAQGFDLVYQPSNDPLEARLAALFDCDNGNYFKGMLGEFGLSFRDPLSDRRVVEYCLSIPGEEFLRGGTERGLARRAFTDRVPKAVTDTHLRGYQGADWYEKVARDLPLLRAELEVIGRCSDAAQALDTRWIADTIETLPSRGLGDPGTLLRYRYGLLRGISAGHFMRKVAGTN